MVFCPLVSMLPVSSSLDKNKFHFKFSGSRKARLKARRLAGIHLLHTRLWRWRASSSLPPPRRSRAGPVRSPKVGFHPRAKRYLRRKRRTGRWRVPFLRQPWSRAACIAGGGEGGVGRHNAERRIGALRRGKFEGWPRHVPRPWMQRAKAAELSSLLEWRRPEIEVSATVAEPTAFTAGQRPDDDVRAFRLLPSPELPQMCCRGRHG